MNPNQRPGTTPPGGAPTPPDHSTDGPVLDIPEDGFGFADEQPQLPPVVRTAQYTSPPRPTLQPILPQPTPSQPLQATPPESTHAIQPQPTLPPANIMPPATVPAVPTLAPTPAPQPAPVQAPSPAAPVAPRPTAYASAQTTPLPSSPVHEPFDPAKVPVHASSMSENPLAGSASFTPTSGAHLPEDIAARIAEQPIQNSRDIMRQIKHGLDGSRLKSILSFIVFTAGIFIAALLINQFIFQSYYVEGNSMVPSLHNNDRLIISKVERTLSAIQGKPYIPERGQIVVLDSSIVGLNGQHEQLIKRVIGLPGDRLHIEAGTVIITNQQHPEGYDVTKDLGLTNLQPTHSDDIIDVIVPQGHVYVMGDNREQGGSYDSRKFGTIEGNKIQGRLWGRVLPLDKAQLY